jgi:hypothetical protein
MKVEVGGKFLKDFSKAFDNDCHCLLLQKFAASPNELAHGDLLRSYLSGRIQRIRIGNCVSSEIWVTSGVPQGSLLGPLHTENTCSVKVTPRCVEFGTPLTKCSVFLHNGMYGYEKQNIEINLPNMFRKICFTQSCFIYFGNVNFDSYA